MSYPTALMVASIHCSINNFVEDEEATTRHNAEFDQILAHDDDHMVAAWDASIEGWRQMNTLPDLPKPRPPGADKGRLFYKYEQICLGMVIRIEKKMQVAPIEAGRDNTPITLPARTPLTFEQACRAVGLKLKQARRYMADPDFKRNFDGVLAGYRASLAPGNIAVARSIRDDESVEPKARLKACEYLDGPRPLATGPIVNIAQVNNSGAATVLPGYVIKLNDPAPKTIDNKADAPATPRGQANPCEGNRRKPGSLSENGTRKARRESLCRPPAGL
jgi:hypothetical protein